MAINAKLQRLTEAVRSRIPMDEVSSAVFNQAEQSLPEPIFNHSLRVFLLASRLYDIERAAGTAFLSTSTIAMKAVVKPEVLFAACMFHDMGTCSACNGPQRFEVEGGDAAVAFLRSNGVTEEGQLHAIWCAIALHTSVGIAERIDPFTRLVRLGVKADFAPEIRESLGLREYATEIEKLLPRQDIERVLAVAVVTQATRGELEQGLYTGSNGEWTDSRKFPKASWPGILRRGHLERVRDQGGDWTGPNPAF